MKRFFGLLMVPVVALSLSAVAPIASAQEKKDEPKKEETKKKSKKKKKGDEAEKK